MPGEAAYPAAMCPLVCQTLSTSGASLLRAGPPTSREAPREARAWTWAHTTSSATHASRLNLLSAGMPHHYYAGDSHLHLHLHQASRRPTAHWIPPLSANGHLELKVFRSQRLPESPFTVTPVLQLLRPKALQLPFHVPSTCQCCWPHF